MIILLFLLFNGLCMIYNVYKIYSNVILINLLLFFKVILYDNKLTIMLKAYLIRQYLNWYYSFI